MDSLLVFGLLMLGASVFSMGMSWIFFLAYYRAHQALNGQARLRYEQEDA